MRPRRFSLALLALPLLLASCRLTSPPGTFFSSRPPGARLIVDGRDAGYVTPCILALDEDRDHHVRLVLSGYEDREIALTHGDRWAVVPWRLGSITLKAGLRFPLFLPWDEFLLPYELNEGLSPARIHVDLVPEGGA